MTLNPFLTRCGQLLYLSSLYNLKKLDLLLKNKFYMLELNN